VEISFLRNNKKKKAKASLQSKVISTQTTIVEESDEADAATEGDQRESDNKFDLEQLNGIFPELEKKLKDFNIDVSLFPKKQKLGLKIQDTENEKGVQVLEVADSSLAANAGLMKGDLITQIDGQNITNTDEARMKLHEIEGRSSYFIKLLRKSKEMQLEIKTPKPLKTADL
jgi:C-terminal processing protease CtpA/Prc